MDNMGKVIHSLTGLSRKKDSENLLKIADVLAKFSTSLTPGGQATYEISKIALQKVRDFVYQRFEKRLLDFHKNLLYKNDALNEELENCEIEDTNYHALLDACISEFESEKTTAYATLARSIALRKVDAKHRRYFIQSLKTISWDQLEFLRLLYVITKFTVISNGAIPHPRHMLKTNQQDPLNQLIVKNLTMKGFLDEVNISKMGLDFVEACLTQEELSPHAYSFTHSNPNNCMIITLTNNNEISKVTETLLAKLKTKNIKIQHVSYDSATPENHIVQFANCGYVLFDTEKVQSSPVTEKLNLALASKKILQLAAGKHKNAVGQSQMSAPLITVFPASVPQSCQQAVDWLAQEVPGLKDL